MRERTWKNCTYAARLLVRSPAFTVTAVLSVAIGVGATTSIFSLVDAALLRPRPGIADPDRLVDVGRTDRDRPGPGFDTVSYPNYVDFRDRSTQVAGLAAYDLEPQAVALGGRGDAERIFAQVVTANYFDVLGARAPLGRFFIRAEDRPGADPVVVLSHALFVRRFGADPRALSASIFLNGVRFRAVGVAPRGFQGTSVLAPDIWLPISARLVLWPSTSLLTDRRASWLLLVGRLAGDGTIARAQAELSIVASDLERDFPVNDGRGIRVLRSSRLPGQMGTAVGTFLAVLMAVSAVVLLLACVNLAGLLIARAAGRTREIAIRLAIGGAPSAIAAQLATEALLVFVLAAPVGLALAAWMTTLLAGFLPRLPVPVALDLALDWRVLAFSLLVTLAAGLLTALIPAVQASRPALLPGLRGDESIGRTRLRARHVLVSAQVALSCLLLVTAGLFARTIQRAATIDPGFNAADLELATIDLSLARHTPMSGLAFGDRLLARVRALPGVRHAAFAADLPLDGRRMGCGGFALPGRSLPSGRNLLGADCNLVSPGYFDTMGIQIVSGRDFTDSDSAGSPRVAIVSESMARLLWPGQAGVGQWLEQQEFDESRTRVQVAGIAKDTKYESLNETSVPFVYLPLAQQYRAEMTLHLRSSGGRAFDREMRAVVHDLDPNLPIVRMTRMEQVLALAMLPQRIAAILAGALGLVGLLLAVIGVYGVTAYLFRCRTREIGIRLALGARPIEIIGAVVRSGAAFVASGLIAGLLVSLAVSRVLTAFLSGVGAADPLTYGGAALILGASAALAGFLPARRAASLDPARTLRGD